MHLATISESGRLELLDLLDEHSTVVGELGAPVAASTDGRYVFASSAAGGVTIADTGAWTVDHEDHVHYYRAEPRVLGTVHGTGQGVVRSHGTLTLVSFPQTGTVSVLDHAALGGGALTELLTLELGPGSGPVVPLGSVILAGVDTGSGRPDTVRAFDSAGALIAEEACAELDGTITTTVGVVYGCADGALLITEGTDGLAFERIPYPGAVPDVERARVFANRAGRPTVAAPAGSTGAWLLDTRERSWTRIGTSVPLTHIAAVDDAENHAVAVTSAGTVLVLDAASGTVLAETPPIVASSLSRPELAAGIGLTVDAQRAYVNGAAENLVHEIDFADAARIARTFAFDAAPAFVLQTGR